MNQETFGRRTFLSGVATATAVGGFTQTSGALSGYDAQSVALDTLLDTGNAIASYDSGMIEIAKLVGPQYEAVRSASRDVYHPDLHVFEFEKLNPSIPIKYGHVRPVLKIIEVLDAELSISLPNYKLLNAYHAGESLTTIGGIMQAVKSIGRISMQVATIDQDPDRRISDVHRISFGLSILTLVAELAFAFTPVSFSFPCLILEQPHVLYGRVMGWRRFCR